MGWLMRAAVAAVGGALLIGAGVAIQVQNSFPVLDGTLAVQGLRAPVDIRRDAADVTHVLAQSPQDAWFAMGYVHAQERGWQLEFNRRVMHGRLSEVLGSATLEMDRLMRALDIRGVAQRQYVQLPAVAQEALRAYSAGIQAFYDEPSQAWSPEFLALGLRPGQHGEPAWTPEDSVGWTLMMALDLGGNWGHEWARLQWLQQLDTPTLWELAPPYPGEPPATSTDLAALYRQLQVYRTTSVPAQPQEPSSAQSGPLWQTDWKSWATHWVDQVGAPYGRGSNNWAVHGTRTASGKPLVANDPHLGLSAPAIWYFARLQSPAGTARDGAPIPPLDVIGATLPGMPFVVLGRTAQVAWGFTNTNPDVQDLYLEQIDPQDPTRYRTPDGWAPFTVREERIRVKGAPDDVVRIRHTRHGPVLSDVQPSHGKVLDLQRYVLALRWSALDDDSRTILAALRANHANSVDELFEAYADHHSPMQSVVAADVQGTVRFQAVGRMPLRAPDNDLRGMAPAPGWEARYDWTGWVPYAQNPRDDGQTHGWVATANQKVLPADYPHFVGQDWSLPYRYQRIAERLQATPQHDLRSMQQLQNDVHSLATARLLPFLLEAPARHPLWPAARAQFEGFDGAMHADQAAPLVFAVWMDELARGLIAPRIGAELFATTYGKRDFRAGLEGMLERNDTRWCGAQGCAEASARALERALDRIAADQGHDPAQWQWGRWHVALSSHRPFGNVPLLARWFDVRTPSSGDTYTVNVGQYHPHHARDPFANRHAASLRAVYDLDDPERSVFIYQTGQSGLVFSPRYRDMAQAWAQGDYRPLQLNPARWRHRLTLQPRGQ